ncbi:cyclin-dependent protein kinase inhibitor Siamese [Striga asiatica]|uniref:Cyclin-dependent protein kinase inhibitor Siamese n=1 Tax=Striga asiatica TaxID=4170 RepID=A0A5A7P8A2_STRAF|nr:cyclin-dependent protein kinase inhibitor Siamese [Striga asiatica]
MSADLELNLLPIIKIIIPHTKSESVDDDTREEEIGQDLASCCTPKSTIPAALICPPAPRKPPPEKRRRWCKRKSIVGTEELETFFKVADQRINIRRRLLIVIIQIAHGLVRCPTLLQGLHRTPSQTPDLLPHNNLTLSHQPPHEPLHLLPAHHSQRHPQCQPCLLRQQRRIHPLLRIQRPRHHRHSSRYALQRRVPPAVRHKPSHRPVLQDSRLRDPPCHQKPPVPHSLLKPLRQKIKHLHRAVPGTTVEEGAVRRSPARRPHNPHEPLPAQLQPSSQLTRLILRQSTPAPERHQHNRLFRLTV